MTFLLSSTFTDSLAKLTASERKMVKTTAFDLQANPANPEWNGSGFVVLRCFQAIMGGPGMLDKQPVRRNIFHSQCQYFAST